LRLGACAWIMQFETTIANACLPGIRDSHPGVEVEIEVAEGASVAPNAEWKRNQKTHIPTDFGANTRRSLTGADYELDGLAGTVRGSR
jgi:hypothetical protein